MISIASGLAIIGMGDVGGRAWAAEGLKAGDRWGCPQMPGQVVWAGTVGLSAEVPEGTAGHRESLQMN